MKKVIIYHNDADGKCSAAIAGRYQKFEDTEVEYIATDYADPVPWDRLNELVHGKDEIWVVDFSYGEPDMFHLAQLVGESNFYWFDHHETQKELFETFERLNGTRMTTHAACFLVWVFCNTSLNPATELPLPVRFIADRDLWKFEHGDDTRFFYEIYLQEEDTHPNSKLWDWYLTQATTDEILTYLSTGKALRKARRRQLKSIALRLGYEVKLDGTHLPQPYRVLKMNYPGSGDMGEVVRQELGYDIAWCYTETRKDVVGMVRENNLYSATVDVGAIAKAKGGGGHKGAAGFVEQI